METFPTRLSVNVDKIATLRNARGGSLPCPVDAARRLQTWGADGITVHPRPDARHITYADVRALRPVVHTEFNIEGYPSPDFVDLVLEVRPEQVTLVSIEQVPEGMTPVALVRGSTARSRNIGRDIGAVLKNVVGGEVVSYTKLMADAREEALYRMQEDALRQGATMVVGVRFASSLITQGVSEIVAWGTAVAPEAR